MSGWDRALGAGVVMIVGGLLGLGGHRWGWMLGAAGAAAAVFAVREVLGPGKRRG